MIEPFFHFEPVIPETAYVHPRAYVVGRVALGEHASIWPGAVLRGDINSITVGDWSNIQDNSVLHVADDLGVVVGRNVVAGHAVRLHGCTIEDNCLIGIAAIVLNGAVVGENCILAAGCLVPEGRVLEPNGLYMGAPAKWRRALTTEEIDSIPRMARKYSVVAQAWRANGQALAEGRRLGAADWEGTLEEMHRRMGGPATLF